MKIVGCDLHARQQTIAMVDTETGEFNEKTLSHEANAVGEFYGALEGPGGGHRSHRRDAVPATGTREYLFGVGEKIHDFTN
jgi:hypothetical protein